ncbi:MAG: sugar kinase [Chloroflexi bacterium]|nr:sugar kinase [Chloroflexota bacterium]
MADYDILVLGEINVDLVLQAGDITPVFGQEKFVERAILTLGSSSMIFACATTRLGLRTALVGVAGDDEFGQFILRALQERGVDTSLISLDPSLKTGVTVSLSTPRDRAMLTFPGCIPALAADQVNPQIFSHARHVHVGSYFLQQGLQPGLFDLLRAAKREGCSTSLDPGWDPWARWNGGLRQVLQQVDIFLPNREEAAALTGESVPTLALEQLTRWSPVVVVKGGAQGAWARRGDEWASVPALPIPVLDVTGAGDAFDAGFIFGLLQGWNLKAALRAGCICGSLSTRAVGGTEGQPTFSELWECMQKFDDPDDHSKSGH